MEGGNYFKKLKICNDNAYITSQGNTESNLYLEPKLPLMGTLDEIRTSTVLHENEQSLNPFPQNSLKSVIHTLILAHTTETVTVVRNSHNSSTYGTKSVLQAAATPHISCSNMLKSSKTNLVPISNYKLIDSYITTEAVSSTLDLKTAVPCIFNSASVLTYDSSSEVPKSSKTITKAVHNKQASTNECSVKSLPLKNALKYALPGADSSNSSRKCKLLKRSTCQRTKSLNHKQEFRCKVCNKMMTVPLRMNFRSRKRLMFRYLIKNPLSRRRKSNHSPQVLSVETEQICCRSKCMKKRTKRPKLTEKIKEEKEINEAFTTLREILPATDHNQGEDSEEEKVSTLKLATSYIQALSELLKDTHLSDVDTDDGREFSNADNFYKSNTSSVFLAENSLSLTDGNFSMKSGPHSLHITGHTYKMASTIALPKTESTVQVI